jgi:hypothetical protein
MKSASEAFTALMTKARRAGDRSLDCRREVLAARKALEKGKK